MPVTVNRYVLHLYHSNIEKCHNNEINMFHYGKDIPLIRCKHLERLDDYNVPTWPNHGIFKIRVNMVAISAFTVGLQVTLWNSGY